MYDCKHFCIIRVSYYVPIKWLCAYFLDNLLFTGPTVPMCLSGPFPLFLVYGSDPP